jgi:Domain of unknown function (DUF1707)
MEPVIGDEIMYEIKRLHADMRRQYRIMGIDQPLNGTAVTARLPWSGYYYFDPPSPGTIATYQQRSAGMALVPPEKEWLPEVIFLGRNELRQLAEAAAARGLRSQYGGREIAPYIQPETAGKPTQEKDITPPGVHLTPELRVGDETRNKFLGHLADMMSRGFIDQQEYDARLAIMMRAQTREDLKLLVKDLPSLIITEPPSSPENRSPCYLLYLSLVSMAGSLALCTAGLIFAGLTLMTGFMWGLLFLSIVITLFCIVKR